MTNLGLQLLPTAVVGSYPQPDWLVDRAMLAARVPPRIRAREIWRVPEPYLEEAQDDATLVAIRAMERAGVDIISDGEVRRESYSNRFATALDGVDTDHPARGLSRRGGQDLLPRIIGPIRRRHPVEVRDVEFLRAHTDRAIKITVPGPFTMSQQVVDEHYGDERLVALDFAVAVNQELLDLVAAGADVVQIDEPYLQARVEKAARFAVEAINRALGGVTATTVLHTCFGYGAMVKAKQERQYPFFRELRETAVEQVSVEAAEPGLDLSTLPALGEKTVVLGVLDLGTEEVETPEMVAARIRAALQHVPAARLVVAPDCGMKYLSRGAAFGKLRAMVEGTRIVRRELGG